MQHTKLSKEKKQEIEAKRIATRIANGGFALSEDAKESISKAAKKAWETRERRIIPWDEIQNDFDTGMARVELFEKHNISRHQLREAVRANLFIGSYRK